MDSAVNPSGCSDTRLWLHRIQCAAFGLGISAFTFYLYTHDPVTTPLMPICAFHYLTGWYCPGCGGLRAVYHLMHGDWQTALRYNPFIFMLLPFIGWWYSRMVLELFFGWRIKKIFLKPVFIYGFVGLFCLFWMIRNFPGLSLE